MPTPEQQISIPSLAPDVMPDVNFFGLFQVSRLKYDYFLDNVLGRLQNVNERPMWRNDSEFLWSLVGYAVGLGNIWRFPYKTYSNGGGAFLILYLIILFAAGLPLLFLELTLGQFSSLGMISVWKIAPLFKGIGYGMIFLAASIAIYYNIIIMYAVYYFMVSFVNLDTPLPWINCTNEWNTKWCIVHKSRDIDAKFISNQKICTDQRALDNTIVYGKNETACYFNNFTTAPLEYWTNFVLRLPKSTGIGDLGPVSFRNAAFLFLIWLLVYFFVKNGIKSSGKIIYFTTTFPYVILTVLLIRGLTLDGYLDGIKYFIIPQWDKLVDVKVWGEAAIQVIFSLGIGFGPVIAMSSHSKFNSNCCRNAVLVTLIDCGTSIYGGLVIFSFLGNMAHKTRQDVANVINDGKSLLFVVYPEGISGMPGAGMWSLFFFFMVINLGLSSEFAAFDGVITTIIDELPVEAQRWRSLISGIACFICFLIGLSMVSGGGIYVFTLMDRYSNSFSVIFICIMEMVIVNWVYGFREYKLDVKMMLGYAPGIYWKYTWMCISPFTFMFIIIMYSLQSTPLGYGKYVFEHWAQVFCSILTSTPIIIIVITAILQLFKFDKNIREAIKPHHDWGPARIEDRVDRYEFYHVQTIRVMSTHSPTQLKVPQCTLEDVLDTSVFIMLLHNRLWVHTEFSLKKCTYVSYPRIFFNLKK